MTSSAVSNIQGKFGPEYSLQAIAVCPFSDYVEIRTAFPKNLRQVKEPAIMTAFYQNIKNDWGSVLGALIRLSGTSAPTENVSGQIRGRDFQQILNAPPVPFAFA